MKYLKYDIYEKVCSMNQMERDLYAEEWNVCCEEYSKIFEQIAHRLPKAFLKEFNKYHMHDNIVQSILIKREVLKKGYRYDLHMKLLDYYDKRIMHSLVFKNIKNLKVDFDFVFAGNCDWIYCEILPVDEMRLSLEVFLFSGSMLYFEFSRLHYKKMKTDN